MTPRTAVDPRTSVRYTGSMVPRAIELDLPLTGAGAPPLAADAVAGPGHSAHLLAVPGIDETTAARLLHAFPSLSAIYAASRERLAEVVGPVAAARLRWFLDAPVTAAALPGRPRRSGGRARTRAA